MLKYSLITIFLLALHCRSGYSKSSAEKECDKIKNNYHSSMGDYIVNGREASLGELPYMVALALGLKTGNLYHCGGTLVSETCVVTAAHCVNTIDPNLPIIVRVGTTDISNTKWNPKTDHKVAKKTIYPQYNYTLKYNDLAVLKLGSPVSLSANVYPVCLGTNKADPKGQLVVSGWGHTKPNGTMQTHLRVTTVEAVPHKDCKPIYSGYTKELPFGVTPELLCAIGKRNQDTCQGDSGGPLVLPGKDGSSTLEGVTAFGLICGTKPAIYTRISSYLDWIAKTCGFS